MEYRIAICDDCQADRDYLVRLAKEWAGERECCIRVQTFVSAEAFLFQYEEDSGYDILLLDVEMGQMDGVTLAKYLRRKNDTVQIIFVTGYSDYIAEGYEVSALHYLLKPVSREKLFTVLSRAAEKLKKNEAKLTLRTGGETILVPVYQIRYAEVFGNYVTIHARTDITVKMTLGELSLELDDRFFRIGRSAIVNLSQVTRVTKTEVKLEGGGAVPLPRGAYDRINRAIIEQR